MRLEPLQGLSGAATKEASMLKSLQKMQAEWEGLEFRVVPYRDSGKLNLAAPCAENGVQGCALQGPGNLNLAAPCAENGVQGCALQGLR